MTSEEQEGKEFLRELYNQTGGDLDAEVSMYDVGSALGMAKQDAGTLAADLMVQGLVELKTLSGGVGITEQGLDMLQLPGRQRQTSEQPLTLGNGPVLQDQGRETVESLLSAIKTAISESRTPYAQVAEMVIDIKTIETQLLSPQPKVEIIRATLHSLRNNLASTNNQSLAAKIQPMVTD